MVRRLAFALAVTLGFGPARVASALDPHRAVTQYGHDVWLIENGLPQNAVLSVLPSRSGYLWLGTTAGLARFDGARFVVFDKTNTAAIGHNQISALLEDRDGSLWIGTFGGGLTRLRDGEFVTYTVREGLSHDVVRSIAQDREGGLWVATMGHGVDRLDSGRFTAYSTANGLPDNDVLMVAPSAGGGIWLATAGGLSHFADGRFTTYTTRDGLPSNRVISVYEDRKGTLWAGTRDSGLARLRQGRLQIYTTRDGLTSNAVSSIYEDHAGALWLGSKDRGLSRLYDGRFTRYTAAEGLTSDAVYAVHEDREGSLWIATFAGGLNRLRDSRFTVLTRRDGLPHDYVRSVFEDRDGDIWMATFGGGLGLLRRGRFRTLPRDQGLSDRLFCVLRDRRGELWVGSEGRGLVRRTPKGTVRYTTREGLASDNVRALYEDRQGTVWVGTSRGLSRFRAGRWRTFTAADGLSSEAVHAIHEARDGTLWLGTWGGGINRLQNGAFTTFSKADGVPNDFILSFYEDREGSLWIGTLGGGLLRRKDGRFRTYSTRQGLPEDLVYQVLEDGQQNLWVSCNKGIYRVPRKEFDDVDRGLARAVRPVTFGVSDGMRSGECASGSQPLGIRSRDGRLWIPTQGGVVLVDPERLETNQIQPPVVIEEAMVDRRPVAVRGRPSLPPGAGDLEFRYTALSLVAPAKVRFKYRLEGFSEEWVDAGSRRVATYTNIPPGRYQFRVAASNNDGVWNQEGAAFAFRLQPHYYQTYWFYGLVLTGLVLGTLALHRLRVRRVEAQFAAVLAERTRMSRELHDTLAQGFAGIAIHLDAAAASLPKVAPEVRSHLELARALVQESLAEARRSVLDLRPHALERGNLGSALAEMAERLTGDSTIQVEVDGEPRRLPGTVEQHLLRIAQEAVTNALRHARARRIEVRLDFGADRVALRVRDDGRGFDAGSAQPAAAGRHLGLAGIRERAAQIGGHLTMDSHAGSGTELRVEVPAPQAGHGIAPEPGRVH